MKSKQLIKGIFLIVLAALSLIASDIMIIATPDTESPSSPGQAIITSLADTSVNISWEASTDNVGVNHYRIFANGLWIVDAGATSVSISNLNPKTLYEITITAVDDESNESPPSAATSVTTLLTPVTDLSNTATENTITLLWPAHEDAESYEILVDDTSVSCTENTYTHSSLSSNENHQYQVRAISTTNVSPWSQVLTAKTLLQSPTILSAIALDTILDVSWQVVQDVTTYEVMLDGTVLQAVTTNSTRISGLQPNTSHSIKVRAISPDNQSDWSPELIQSTKPQVSVSGTINQNTSWSPNNVYIVNSTVTIATGTTLTIEPGTIIKYKPSTSMVVQGSVSIIASLDNPVIFTSFKDVQYGGSGISTTSDYWNGVYVKSTGSFSAEGLKALYGGRQYYDSNYRCFIAEGALTLVNSEIANHAGTAIYAPAAGSSLTVSSSHIHDIQGASISVQPTGNVNFNITDNTIERSPYGIYVKQFGSGTFLIQNNQISACTTYPIYVNLALINTDFLSGISGNTISATNEFNAIVLDGSPKIDIALSHEGYIGLTNITLPINKTLTLSNGANLRMNANTLLTLNGSINALGTENAPVTITSIKDPTFGGAGSTSTVQAWGLLVKTSGTLEGSWLNLQYGGRYFNGDNCSVYSEGKVILDHTLIKPMDQSLVQIYNMIISSTNTIDLENCTFISSKGYGLRINLANDVHVSNSTFTKYNGGGAAILNYSADDVHLSGNTINGWDTGFYIQTSSVGGLWIQNNTFVNNATNGIKLVRFGTGIFSLTGNSVSGSKSGLFIDLSGLASSVFPGIAINSIKSNYFGGGEAEYTVLANGPVIDLTIPSGKYIHEGGDLTIQAGKTLTIPSGTTILFDTSRGIIVNGSLYITGELRSPVVLAPYGDPDYRVPGQFNYLKDFMWKGIFISSTGSAFINHTMIREGSYSLSAEVLYASIYTQGSLELTNSVLMRNYNTSPLQRMASLAFNTNIQPLLRFNTLNNSRYGVFNMNSANMTVDAKYNYWSSTSGPGNVMNCASAGVEYNPWLGSEIYFERQLGQPGVNAPSGNYSRTFVDMSLKTAGFDINLSRTYNSGDDSSSILGKGWTFGYEGSLHELAPSSGIYRAKMPNGSSAFYEENADGAFTAMYSHDILEHQPDNTFILTTQDQIRYGYDIDGRLSWVGDRNDNRITLSYLTNGKLGSITDPAGRMFTLFYTGDLLSSIVNPAGDSCQFSYTNGLLTQTTDLMGNTTTYQYDTNGKMTGIFDHQIVAIELITYVQDAGENFGKVHQRTDIMGNVFTYTHDVANRTTTITDSSNRITTQYYDDNLFVTGIRDAEGKLSSTTYFTDASGVNRFGDIQSETDRNGNTTTYVRDNRGNPTRITNPDDTYRLMTYDDKNNMTSLTDEIGHVSWYVYDPVTSSLLKEIKPLNGTDSYNENVNEALFSITRYTYYSESERLQNGYAIKGLLKSITSPENEVETRYYDFYGNLLGKQDPETGLYTTFTYNTLGFMTSTTSAKGYITSYVLDPLGRVEKITMNGNDITRMVYDSDGNKVKEISPNQYDAEDDLLAQHAYTGDYGSRWQYRSNGTLETFTDAEGFVSAYTFDMYGNKLTETLPSGAVYRMVYDMMNRPVEKWYKANASANEVQMESWLYEILTDGKTRISDTVFLNESDYATTIHLYDTRGREIRTTLPDGTYLEKSYLENGLIETEKDVAGYTIYYQYDGLNRLSKEWTPFAFDGITMTYAYKAYSYDKCDRQLIISTGKDAVNLYEVPSSFITQSFSYYKNGKTKTQEDSDGRKTEYAYDADGSVAKIDVYTDSSNKQITEFTSNHLGKPLTQKVWVRKGDLAEYASEDNSLIALVTTMTYDANGNLVTRTQPDGVTTTFLYDNLNQQIGSRYLGTDEYGIATNIEYSRTLDWGGRPLTETDANGNTTTNLYDERGLLVQTIAPDGGISISQYDLSGRKVLEVSPKNYDPAKTVTEMTRKTYEYDLLGRLLKSHDIWYNPETSQWEDIVASAMLYDAAGNVIKKLDALGYEAGTGLTHIDKALSGYGTEYVYNAANLCVSERDPVSKQRNLPFSRKYTYDALGRKVADEDAIGHITRYILNDNGLILETTIQPIGSAIETTIQSNTWDLAGNMLTSMDANGNTKVFTYTAFNKPRTIVLPGDATIGSDTQTYQYDVQLSPAKIWNSLGETTLLIYNHEGNLLEETHQNSLGGNAITKTQAWDLNGNLRFIIDGNGVQHEKTYNSMNQLVHETALVNNVPHTTTHIWDLNANEISETDWLGNTTTNAYDALNRLVLKLDPYSNIIEKLEYNHVHAQIASENALGQRTLFNYDRNNRLLTKTDPELHVTSKTYDNNGNIATETDGRGKTTEFSYDALNKLISVENAQNETTSYLLDNCGNLLEQTDGNGHTTTFEYNIRNLPIRRIDHGGRIGTPGNYTYTAAKIEVYTYDSSGRMATRIDRNGSTTAWTYDCHGRIVSESVAGNVVTRTWDGNNNVLTMTDGTGTTTWTYDELNRTLTKEAPVVGTLSYTWDIVTGMPSGHVKQRMVDAANNVTDTVLDRMGRVSQVISGSQTATYTYILTGNRESIVYDNGCREDYTYTDDGLLETLVNKQGNGTVIDSYSYTYDAAHNQTSKTDARGVTEYTYDDLNRLETVIEPNGKDITYTYDNAGNRLTEQIVQGSTTTLKASDYNEQNRLTGMVIKVNGVVTETRAYSWDNNGNLLTTTVNGLLTNTNVYDARNQLTETVTEDITIINGYNGDGLRISKSTDGSTEYYMLNGDQVVLELDENNTVLRRNVFGVNLVLSQIGSITYQYLYNGHADVTALVLPNGKIAGTWYYDAFGVQVEHTGVESMYTYAGYRYDDETGLYYLNARMYDPEMARFLQEDTYRGQSNDPLSLNLYSYCRNNPISYVDPTGHVYIPGYGDVKDEFGINVTTRPIVVIKDLNKLCDVGTYYYTQMVKTNKENHRDKTKNYYDESIPDYTITQKLLTQKGHYGNRMEYNGMKGIVIHWTASKNGTAEGIYNYFENSPNLSSNYTLSSIGTNVLQLVPDNKTAHASGASKSNERYYTKLVYDEFLGPTGTKRINDWTISIETNPIDSKGNFSNETYTSLVRLAADKLLEYDLSVETGLYRHSDFTTKDCPKLFTNPWETWKSYIDTSTGGKVEMGVKPTYNAYWEQFKEDVTKTMIERHK